MSRPLSAAPALPTPTPRASFPVLPGGDSPASRKPPSPTSRTSPDQDQSPTTDASPVSTTAPHPPRIETPRSEGYPSWLPRRPRPPPPQSTVHSQHLDAYVDHPSMGERRPTSRSVRIVSVTPSQTSNENQSQHLPTEGGLAPPPRSPARAYSRHTSAALVSHLNPTPLPAMAPPPPRFATRGLNLQLLRDPSLLSRIRFYTLPLFVFAHIPLQAFFDLNVVYILLQVSKHPNYVAPGVPGSGKNWALGCAAYLACFFIWFFGVFVLYELVYSFYRRWRVKHPLIIPIYLSSPAFNLASMTSYTNFCFLQHIRASAFQPKHSGSLKDGLAETSYFYSQNAPTVALLLPRAALSLCLLFAFSLSQPNTLAVSNMGVQSRDAAFFQAGDGTLTGYAKGILIVNCVWTVWRALVLLASWIGLWYCSGLGCAGLCGPRYRWEEDETEKSTFPEDGTKDLPNRLAWKWRECTIDRIQGAYNFCLATRPESRSSWRNSRTRRGVSYNDNTLESKLPLALATTPLTPGFPIREDPALLALVPPVFNQPAQNKRGILTSDLYTSPTPRSIQQLPGAPLVSLPYPLIPASIPSDLIPFSTNGSARYKAGLLPFPLHNDSADNTRSTQARDMTNTLTVPTTTDLGESSDMEISNDGDEEEEEDEEGNGSGSQAMELDSERGTMRTGSMSSLGQPVPSRYPFQYRQAQGATAARRSGSGSRSRSRATPHSKSSSTNNTRSTPSSRFSHPSRPNSASHHHTPGSNRNSMSPSNRNSTPASNRNSMLSSPISPTSPVSPISNGSNGNGIASISPPPRHPAHAHGESRRRRAGTVPSQPSSPIGLPPQARIRTRTMSASPGDAEHTFGPGPSPLYEIVGRTSLENDENEDSIELELSGDEAEKEDSVGLLSNAPSRQSSFGALRSRTSAGALSLQHRRSRTASIAGSLSGSSAVHASRSASVSNSTGSIRSRAMSLLAQRRVRADSQHSHSESGSSASRSRASSLAPGIGAGVEGGLGVGAIPRPRRSDTRLDMGHPSSTEHTFGFDRSSWQGPDHPTQATSSSSPIPIPVPASQRPDSTGRRLTTISTSMVVPQPDMLSPAPSSFITLPASPPESATTESGGQSIRSTLPAYAGVHDSGTFRPK